MPSDPTCPDTRPECPTWGASQCDRPGVSTICPCMCNTTASAFCTDSSPECVRAFPWQCSDSIVGIKCPCMCKTYLPQDPVCPHTVGANETWESLQTTYCVTLQQLWAYNPGINRTAPLTPGQVVSTPCDPYTRCPNNTCTYTLQAVDTLEAVARVYCLSVQDLAALTPGLDPGSVRPGSTIRVLCNKPPSCGLFEPTNPTEPPSACSYVVGNPDFYKEIAAKYCVTGEELQAMNPATKLTRLIADSLIAVPCSIKKSCSKTPAATGECKSVGTWGTACGTGTGGSCCAEGACPRRGTLLLLLLLSCVHAAIHDQQVTAAILCVLLHRLGLCCGKNGVCGRGDGSESDAFCGAGCQLGFGLCGYTAPPSTGSCALTAERGGLCGPANGGACCPDGQCCSSLG